MSPPEKLSPMGRRFLDRRGFMQQAGGIAGGFSLASLLKQDGLLAAEHATSGPLRPEIDSGNPYASRKPHFEAKAKRLLVIFCAGAVSHVDTFDYKKDLFKLDGQKPPGLPEVSFSGPTGAIAKPYWEFKPRGESGKMISELVPHLAELADDMCFFHALSSTVSAHPTAENFIATGSTFEGFPSIGSWVTYALGTENQNLPAYVAINDPRGMPRSGKNNWANGFLPAAFQGTDFNAAHPPANLKRPDSISQSRDRRAVDLLAQMNAKHLEAFPDDTDLSARISSYELAGRMQLSIPHLVDFETETQQTLTTYGADSKNEIKRDYAKNCILARRLLEEGVRCVHLFNGSDASGGNGKTNWDSHNDIEETHAMQAEIMDQPTVALLADLKQRGLLEDTLVVWCTEFGRMPFLQANGTGRDHNPEAFTSFMMGAGVKPAYSHGASDEFGFKPVENPTTLFDFNATILHLLGLDHERLTFFQNGLERRLTSVFGNVVKEALL